MAKMMAVRFYVFLLLVFGNALCAFSKTGNELVMLSENDNLTTTKSTSAAPMFQYYVNGEIPNVSNDFMEEHFLGDVVEKKWNTFLKNYTHEYSVNVGLSDNGFEILKPAVFNAVKKANKYIRKSVKNNTISHEKAVELLTHILDCANVMISEPDTKQFEQTVNKAKTGSDVIGVFEKVKLIWN